MELEPYIYKLFPDLILPGSSAVLDGRYELAQFTKGGRTFVLEDGISYRLTFANTGGAVLITGTVEAVAHTECYRCLDVARLEVFGEVETLVFFEAEAFEAEADAEDCILAEGPEACVDLTPLLFSAVIFALPLVVLCREDCAGICPNCGAHLNDESCACTVAPADENHPFAVLKSLKQNS